MSRALQNAAVGEEFASGTKMIFNQTAAPTGWTRVTSSNDVALRLVDGSSSVGTGGTVAFETAFESKTPTITANNDPFTLAQSHIANHGHGFSFNDASSSSPSYPIGYTGARTLTSTGPSLYGNYAIGGVAATTGGGNTHTHANAPASSAINLDVSYVDVIIATKD